MKHQKHGSSKFRQKKYRKKQEDKGLSRLELQIPNTLKQKFDRMVDAVSDEYPFPNDKRRRVVLARARIFEEITQGLMHEFYALKEENDRLRAEIKILHPAFIKQHINAPQAPIPDAIETLSDDPQALKQIMATLYLKLQQAKRAEAKLKEGCARNEKLNEVLEQYNDTLRTKLKLAKKETC